jgi:hypothetical protein
MEPYRRPVEINFRTNLQSPENGDNKYCFNQWQYHGNYSSNAASKQDRQKHYYQYQDVDILFLALKYDVVEAAYSLEGNKHRVFAPA